MDARVRLRLGEDAQEVLAQHLLHVVVGPAAAQQLQRDPRQPVDALEAHRASSRRRRSRSPAPRDRRPRPSRCARCDRRAPPSGTFGSRPAPIFIAAACSSESFAPRLTIASSSLPCLREEARACAARYFGSMYPEKKLTMTTPPFFAMRAELVVRQVARGVAEGARARVGSDDGRHRDAQDVVDRLVAHVRDVDEHPDALHLAHDLLAERRQPVVPRLGRRRPRRPTSRPSRRSSSG